MRIGIDARYWGIKDTGIGRYAENLVLHLAKVDKKNGYVVFGLEESVKRSKRFPTSNWES